MSEPSAAIPPARPGAEPPPPRGLTPATTTDPALDTLAGIVRTLGEYALEQPEMTPAAFAELCEAWARHVAIAAPAPGGQASENGRRDWTGVREFVRGYCRGSSRHARTVTDDLRHVVWVFIENLNKSLRQDHEADERLGAQMARLEELARGSTTSELKKEALAVVAAINLHLEERRQRSQRQMEMLGSQVRALGHELDVVRRESEVDPLTRIFNRKALDAFMQHSLELARAFHTDTVLLLVDVDRFKEVNDTLGHTGGDALLGQLADALSRVFLRRSDFVARYGGDEMAVVLRETSLRDAIALAERALRAARSIKIDRDGRSIRPTLSVGIAAVHDGDDLTTWIDRADRALYEAKRRGRDCAVAAHE